jgi:hypothetical protein
MTGQMDEEETGVTPMEEMWAGSTWGNVQVEEPPWELRPSAHEKLLENVRRAMDQSLDEEGDAENGSFFAAIGRQEGMEDEPIHGAHYTLSLNTINKF